MIARLLSFIFILSFTACSTASKVPTAAVNPPDNAPASASEVVLAPGDEIDVKFRFLPELDYQQKIRPDGRISLQMVDEVVVAGLTPGALDKLLTQLYSTKLKSPEITVIVVSLANQNIYVGGEVEIPGVLPLTGRLTALQAVMNAGGFKETAKPESVLIIRKGQENQPIPIPVDLKKVLYGNQSYPDFLLQPSDIVYVPKSSISKANQFVRQYIQELFLFRGVSMGFTYELHNANN